MLLELALSHSPEAAYVRIGLRRQSKVGIEKSVLLGVSDTIAFVYLVHNYSSVSRLAPILP